MLVSRVVLCLLIKLILVPGLHGTSAISYSTDKVNEIFV